MRRLPYSAIAVLLAGCCLMAAAVLPVAVEARGASAAVGAESVGERFGVASSHIKLYDSQTMDKEFDAMRDAGASWVRCDFAWSDLEKTQGVWDFAGADAVVAKAEARGVEVLGILAASPGWANGGMPWNYPPTPAHIDDWKNYVRTVAECYKGKVAAWEIWNEENISAFWQPAPDAAAYVNLLAAASPQIRAADPDATIVMGGVAGLGYDDLTTYLSLGAADYVDAVAYHPYAETIGVEGQPEEDLLRPKEALCSFLVFIVHSLVAQYTTKDLEVWITEVGWTTSAETPPGVDENTQAAYMLRTLITYAATDVDRVIWFNLRDTEFNSWDYYGLLDYDFAPKPSYGYYSTFSDVFGPATAYDADTVTFTSSDSATLIAYCFRLPGGNLALAAWKSDDAADTLSFKVNDPAYQVVRKVDPLTGARSAVSGITRDAQDRVSVSGLPVGKKPLIIELKEGSIPPPTPDVSTFYFAEGYTGAGFQEYLCLGNVDEVDARAEVTFLFPDGSSQEMDVPIPAGSRATVDVNAAVGADREVSMAITSQQDIVAERPMYFSYGAGWTGGHDVMGAREPATSFYFAEGYTGEGFEEWLCVLNPGDAVAELAFSFQTQEEGLKEVSGFAVGPRSRASFKVNDILGGNLQASCMVEASSPVVVERPMYFDYMGRGAHHWQGGHCVMGAAAPATKFLFAEGTTRSGFEEWITLQNPQDSPITVWAAYQFGPGQGEALQKSYDVEGNKRLTLFVPEEAGWEKDVSVELTSDSGFLAERPVYFDYSGAGAGYWQGGHCVIGATSAAPEWFFAEGYTGEGFHEWLCLQNPADEQAVVEIDYLTQEEGALPARSVTVPPETRVTLFVNEHAGGALQLSCRLRVISGPPVVAERPMYFSQGGRDGGHDVVGFTP